jgi:hypothetical protein
MSGFSKSAIDEARALMCQQYALSDFLLEIATVSLMPP